MPLLRAMLRYAPMLLFSSLCHYATPTPSHADTLPTPITLPRCHFFFMIAFLSCLLRCRHDASFHADVISFARYAQRFDMLPPAAVFFA